MKFIITIVGIKMFLCEKLAKKVSIWKFIFCLSYYKSNC